MPAYVQLPAKEKPLTEWAVELLEAISRQYRIQVEITYLPAKYTPSMHENNWRIRVLGDAFYHEDFEICAKKAIRHIYNLKVYNGD